jgi:hypothetical protein
MEGELRVRRRRHKVILVSYAEHTISTIFILKEVLNSFINIKGFFKNATPKNGQP